MTTRLLMLLVLACNPDFTESPPRARPITPPAEWRTLWVEVEGCSRTSGDFDRVRWFEAMEEMRGPSGETVLGVWHPRHDIYFAREIVNPNSRQILDWERRWVVMHTVLHDLLGTADHPAAFDLCRLRVPQPRS